MPTLYLIDAHNALHRAFHALPNLTTSRGEPVGALYGFCRTLLKILKEKKPDFLAVCFDAPGPTFRHRAFKEYKATRKKLDETLKEQMPLARDLARAWGLPCLELAGYEADDLMATLAQKAIQAGFEAVLVSSDKDLMQLVSKKISLYHESRRKLYRPSQVLELYQLPPEKLLDYFTLMGDASDNIPGVSGIGEKTARKLIQEFGSLENLLQAVKNQDPRLSPKIADSLRRHAEEARISRQLIQLNSQVPIEISAQNCHIQPPQEKLLELLKRLEFASLLKEIRFNGRKLRLEPKPENSLKRFIQKCRRGGQAVSLSTTPPGENPARLSLGLDDCTTYTHALGEKNPEIQKLLADSKVKKYGHDLKKTIRALQPYGLRLENIRFDTLLAAYCLNPSRPKQDAAALSLEYLQAPFSLQDSPSEQEAVWVWALAPRLEKELKEKKLEKLFFEMEMPLTQVLADMEHWGILVDIPYLKELSKNFQQQLTELHQQTQKLAGTSFNPNSPKQLARVLFETLKLPVVRKTKTGYSTDEEVLKILAPKHPLPQKLLEYREIAKLKSTYAEALLELADPKTARVHTYFQQAVTQTGRLSSSHPNLQNIPVRSALGQKIRRAFLAPPQKVLLSLDYSQIDLRVLAHSSKDAGLCTAFRNRQDIHTQTASEVFHVPPEAVTPRMRTEAKAVNFGIVYGQQAWGLSQQLGISVGEAQQTIHRYFERYQGVQRWIQQTLELVRREKRVETLFGRVRYIPDILSKNPSIRGFSERVAINTPIQGSSADIIKVAMIRIHQKLKTEKGMGNIKLLLQIHDDLIFEVPEEELRSAAAWIRKEMENAISLEVPLTVDVKWGKNWAELK
ncbi:MAG: DNA polymerase I [Elusimicrobia bacterium]|nr:DNA polymerase I [Elusimicrobiota bacterium]